MSEYWKQLPLVEKVKFVISVVLGIIGVIFATLNWNSQEVHLIFTKLDLPLSLLIIFSIIVGYAISHIFSFRKFKEKDREIERVMKQNQELKNQLEEK